MTTVAAIAGYIGAAAFAALLALLLFAPHGKRIGRLLVAASAASTLWFAGHAAWYHFGTAFDLSSHWLQHLELARDAFWIAFLARLIAGVGDAAYQRRIRAGVAMLGLVVVAAALLVQFPATIGALAGLDPGQVRKLFLASGLLIALGGLVLVEQIFRSTARDSRWALKHLCFGLGFVFAYDFYLYADAVLFNRLDLVIWSMRGVINALAVPLIAISAARNRDWDLNIFVSRRVVFHGVALAGAGLYLIAMAIAGYYLQAFGGEWGRALRTAFFSAAILFLLTLFFSVQVRSRLRLFLAKHFYRNKYEYGEEWLGFTQALARTSLDPASLNSTLLAAVCDIVDSPGGILWRRMPAGDFAVAATLSMYGDCTREISANDPFVTALARDPAVCNLTDEAQLESERCAHLPTWLLKLPRVALVVPIVHGEDLLAILALARPRSNQRLDWEDMDLLGTVARQAASYLALVQATDALSEARQFETFNRLSAFLVHDLKNVVAQLSLIVSNARRHGRNPEFVDDAFNTVADAVAKMNRMLASLRQMHAEVASDEVVDLGALLAEAVARKRDARPAPTYAAPAGENMPVRASRDRLLSVIEHLLQNAIEATDTAGRVTVAATRVGDEARVTIADTGCGMDREFINNRLFKPFDTTKGKAGMGIGAYESRHVISSMQGELRVDSEPGVGTTFTIVLPCADGTQSASRDLAVSES
jgi:putative PEP-CTERM system histidine kinase